MKITLLRSYPKLEDGTRKVDSKGNPIIVFVYKVTGTKEDIAKYKELQAAAEVKTIADEDGTVLWFTTRPVGKTGTLKISTNDKIYADTTALDLADSMIKQHPGQLGTMLAKSILEEGFAAEPAAVLEEGPVEDDKL